MDEDKLLFSDIKFIIAQCYNTDHIRNVLIEGGAKHINYLSEHVTLVISDTHCSEAEEAVELFDKPVVTSLWVHLSIKAKKLLPTEAFSPFKTIFHNVVASFSSTFSRNDIDTLASTLIYYGARVTKDVAASTHFIVPDSNLSDLSNRSPSISNLKIVAPDWIIESVKHKRCCEESLFDPELLLPPPPPTPPPPSPPPPRQPQQPATRELQPHETEKETPINQLKPDTKSTENKLRFDDPQAASNPPQSTLQRVRPQQVLNRPPSQNHQQQFIQHPQSQINHPAQKPLQTMPASNLPRPQGMPQNIIRTVQPRFRPILPPNSNAPMPTPIQQKQSIRGALPDSQQPKKVTMNFGPQYRKQGPHQNNTDPQQQASIQQQPAYVSVQSQQQQPQTHQHMNIQQQSGTNVAPTRLPQPTMYNQVRGTFPNSHMPPRGKPAQQQMVNSQQPTQMINRFQDPNTPMSQRPYQVCLQPQGVKSNYQPNNMPRPIYYSQQGNNQVQVRMPQQGPPVRHMQNDQIVYDNFNLSQQPQEPLSTQQHYQGHPPQQSFHNTHQQSQPQPQQFQPPPPHQHHPHGQIQIRGPSQPQQQIQSQPSPIPHGQHQIQNQSQNMSQNTAPFQSNFFRGGPGPQHIRAPRTQFVNQQQQQPQKSDGPRHMSTEQMASQQVHPVPDNNQVQSQLVTRVQSQPSTQTQTRPQPQPQSQPQPQPHPSIFDHIQESNLAQIKAQVPIVTETFDYFGHDPKDIVPKDLPLSGCRFKFTEYDEISPKIKQQWFNGIKIAGGLLGESLEGVTHLICETRNTDIFEEAIKLGIRCVTIYWINDVLAQNKLSYPWKALHFPTAFAKNNRPLTNQTVSITNFRGRDRKELKEMILKAGGLYTDYFSTSNSLLICGNVGGDKYEHALEWKVPIANCQILSDVLLNNDISLDSMLSQSKYQLFNQGDSLKLTSYSSIQNLMKPWRKPLSVAETSTIPTLVVNSADDSGIATGASNNSDPDTNGKPQATDVVLASDDKSNEHTKCRRKSNDPVRILFTHLETDLVNKLTTYASKLGLSVASGPSNCTHLIVDGISRTPKFICAFNYATYILSYKWIIESHEVGSLLDEKQFILRDLKGEETFSFNLVYSLLKRKKRRGPLFNHIVFFVTPQVLAKAPSIKEMIESAGGVVATKKLPSRLQITQMKADGKRFVVVSSKEDLHLCSALEAINVDIVDAEFVVSGILRQDIDFEAHRLRTTTEVPFIRPETSPKAHISQPSPPKKLRLEDSSSLTESSN